MPDIKTQMHTNRSGETGSVPHRTRRFYNNGKEWFFITRDGNHHGGVDCNEFGSRITEAEAALKLYLRRCGIVRYIVS